MKTEKFSLFLKYPLSFFSIVLLSYLSSFIHEGTHPTPEGM